MSGFSRFFVLLFQFSGFCVGGAVFPGGPIDQNQAFLIGGGSGEGGSMLRAFFFFNLKAMEQKKGPVADVGSAGASFPTIRISSFVGDPRRLGLLREAFALAPVGKV